MSKCASAVHAVRAVIYIAFFAALYYLFMHQASGEFPSDLPAHITPPADDTYSAVRFVYVVLSSAFGVQGICAFLALVNVGTVAVSEYLLRKLAPGVKPLVALVAAVACNFAIAVYVPLLHPYFVVGSPGGNCWHNSTYAVMRLLALGAIVFYLKFDGVIAAKSNVRSWLLFTLFVALATSVKPSFAIVFGPAVFAVCVLDLVTKGKSTVRKSLLVGLSLVVALAVVFYQLLILFPSDGSADGGIAFGLAKVWRARHANIFVSFLQSLAFPLLATAVAQPKFWKDRTVLLAWFMTIVAMAEYVFLYETGARTYHGNFGWGLSFALFYLFIVAAALFVRKRGVRLFLASPRQLKEPLAADCPGDAVLRPATRNALDYLTIVAFALHFGSGVWYFARVLMGHSFY